MIALEKTSMDSTVNFEVDGVHLGHLRVPHSVHRSAYGHIAIPIAVLKNGAGPTVLLTGGVHGDEYEGPVALSNFVQKVRLDEIQGRVVVVPALNYPAFMAASRVSPIDGINLNRTFPGRKDGSVTEVIADYVTRVLLPLADFVFDVHAGGSSLQYLPSVLSALPDESDAGWQTARLIEAMAPERIIYFDGDRALSGEDRVIGNYARKNGAVYLCGEFGGGSTVNPDGLRMVEHCVSRFLMHLGVLSAAGALQYAETSRVLDQPVRTLSYSMDEPGLFLFAQRPGFFAPSFRLGEVVRQGQLAGHIYDSTDFWKTPTAVTFECGGLVVCQRTFAQVEVGDCLGHLAQPC
ncbi:succinylglutamate desuccinylase [Paraburkholderia sp. Tr-20389]|uniref:succinylglutamate desuccinylase/aspartoacylase family protein n=1 Tax=Paraburkholderia sp. Tr-20389 TaxID=2703903 RepID=UPI00197D4943|nr:succinylglutamate desuccinylase/aspartoacylase family protein [Paraburkholderia sp. Tr-20389]MBN3754380.1 succinylglutamate desuccinylase [Paraburkholderia sp. Tr-20389]